ncbi:MAG: sugar phosphate isomerase/epimerase [Microbacterium sp.]|uniref:sugar phosphate isomerase/epimerase family protein n=1 Tax=Microbacterium sp. TaxID=51671 RepID=UPI0039E43206
MTTPVLSLQLYTIRPALEADQQGALERVKALGIDNVEAFGFVGRAGELRGALDSAGLTARSGHASFISDEVRFGGQVMQVPPFEQTLDEAEALGLEYLIDPMTSPDHWASRDGVAALAERMNTAAAQAAQRGIRVGYHNHSQEFHHSFDGVCAYEAFVALLDDSVALELDAYWAQVGGQDLTALSTRLGDRLKALHVKDGTVGVDPFRTGEFDPVALGQVPAGLGEVALDAVLNAATALELAVVEFDHYEGDIFDGIAGTVGYLAERGIR